MILMCFYHLNMDKLANCYFPMGGIEVEARTGELEDRDEIWVLLRDV